jgi:spermidine dehydrogenase
LTNVPADQRGAILENMDYQTYLKDCAGMDDEVLKIMLSAARGVWAVNTDAYPALAAWRRRYPGFGDLDLGSGYFDREAEEKEPFIFHFPDGNASVARLLVRKLIPAADFV